MKIFKKLLRMICDLACITIATWLCFDIGLAVLILLAASTWKMIMFVDYCMNSY